MQHNSTSRYAKMLYLAVLGLLAYMPFHVFLSQWSGAIIGGLEFWKIAKDLVIIILFVITGVLVWLKVSSRARRPYMPLVWLVAVYAMLHIITYLINKNTTLEVAGLASTYNNRFIWMGMTGIGLGLLVKKRPFSENMLVRLVLIVSIIVCALGILQWFLPSDILTHFGYSKALGVKPNFFINEDPTLPRVFATFRDPNSLGAYLLVPILLLVGLIQKSKKKLALFGLLALHLIVLYLTFSRAAWGGLIIGLGASLFVQHKDKTFLLIKRFWPVFAAAIVLIAISAFSFRHTPAFRNIVLKANDKNAPTELDSDEYHLRFMVEGMKGVVSQPIGHGPGTAGVVSIHNVGGGQLTENYYIQIAYEVGILGLVVFIAIWVFVIRLLYRQETTPLIATLLSTATAYTVMSLVMHLWTNEAVAITWWGLSGLALFPALPATNKPKHVQGSTLYMRNNSKGGSGAE